MLKDYYRQKDPSDTYLVLAKEWNVQNNLEGLSVSRKDHQIGQAPVQSFGRLIGALLQLYHLTKGETS